MWVAFYPVATGDERSVDGIGIDIDIVLIFETRDLVGCGVPAVVDRSVIEIPIVMGVVGLCRDGVFDRPEGGA